MGGLLAFVGAAYGVEKALGLTKPVSLSPVVAVLLAAVPALLWLGYFYLQDRKEPEPKHYVFGVFLLGALAAAPVATFVTARLLPEVGGGTQLYHWYDADRLLRGILVVALAQELAKYAVVRYTVYLSDEFDEPMDGIVYMTAAGIGFATALNVDYLHSAGGVFLTAGAINTVVTTLAHACVAGVLGYFLGRAKFAEGGAHALALIGGLFGAAILNGVFSAIEEVVRADGVKVAPWRGLAWAAGFAAVVFFAVSLLMRRQMQYGAARS